MKKFLRLFAFALLLPVVVSCGDATGPEEDITGTYNLETVDGKSLPAVVEDSPGFRVEILSMTMVLNQDNTFTLDEAYRFTEGGEQNEVNESSDGSWERQGDTVIFRSEIDDDMTGRLGRGTITFTFEGNGANHTLVFRKGT